MHRPLLTSLAVVSALGVVALASTPQASPAPNTPASQDGFASEVQPVLKKNCLMCHNDGAKAGGMSVSQFHSASDAIAYRDLFERISERVKNGEMPPKGMPKPSATEIARLTGWIDHTFEALDRNTPPDPGRLTAHRLNKFEYNNAVHDLLGIDIKPAADFPADDSGYGFDNIGDVLSVSPVLMEKYLTAAEQVARKVIPSGALPKPTREKLANPHHRQYAKAPTGEYLHYQVVNEADYDVRANVRGKREPLCATLLIDNVAVASTELQFEDDEAPRFIEFHTHLTAGDHRLGARLVRSVAVLPMGKPPDLAFLSVKRSANSKVKKEPPPPTPWVETIELRGPYNPQPAPMQDAQKRFLVCTEATEGCAAQIVRSFAARAWRRPLSEAEVAKLVGFVSMARDRGDSFDQGLRLAIEATLVSPNFLFRMERDPHPLDSTASHEVTDSELASRLSFFLWSSVPDAQLLHEAEEHTLHTPAVLKAELARMLKDGKSRRFAENFAGQWLQLRNLDSIQPDPDKFPEFDDLRADMRTETRMFFASVLHDDRSILDFIDGKYTFVNEALAKFYGIPGIEGEQFRRVDLDGAERSGVLTQASVLTVSSYPTRTSPVIRGKWVLENLLNAPPPPPPPNVPALIDAEVGKTRSMRQQLESHRANPVCASCHNKMDPLGFGLENYDAIGRWRTRDGNFPIDSSGAMPNGKSFSTPEQMKAILRSNPRAFAQCLTEKVMIYALGRGLERYDRPAVAKVVDRLAANDYRFSELLSGVVESLPFQMRRGEGETHVTQSIAQASHP